VKTAFSGRIKRSMRFSDRVLEELAKMVTGDNPSFPAQVRSLPGFLTSVGLIVSTTARPVSGGRRSG
jgi:hypothetical protein